MKKLFKLSMIIVGIYLFYLLINTIYESEAEYQSTSGAKVEREAIRIKEAEDAKRKAETIPTSEQIRKDGFIYSMSSWSIINGTDDVKLASLGMNFKDSKDYTYIAIELNVKNTTKEAKLFKAGNLAVKFGANAPFMLPPLDSQIAEGFGHTKIVNPNSEGTTIFAYKIPTNMLEAKESKIYYIPLGLNNYGLYVAKYKPDASML